MNHLNVGSDTSGLTKLSGSGSTWSHAQHALHQAAAAGPLGVGDRHPPDGLGQKKEQSETTTRVVFPQATQNLANLWASKAFRMQLMLACWAVGWQLTDGTD